VKRLPLVVALLLLLHPTWSVAVADDTPRAEVRTPASRLSALDWLAGRWLQESKDERVEVIYTTSEGGSILGLTKVSGGGATHFFELEKIAVEGDAVVLVPFPDGQRAASFRLVEDGARRAVFESPKNDFPRRIVFDATREGALEVVLEGSQGGQPSTMRLALKRA
jgi:hypothetical protein